MRRLLDLAKRFRKDESGAFMVLFAVLAIVLIAVAGSVVDFTNTQTSRSRAQTALDAAALALQTQISTQTTTQLKTKAQSILNERLNDSSITATVSSVTVDTTNGKIDIYASISVPTAFVQLVGVHSISANLQSEVQRGSKDLEVSVALDTTGSMAGSKIAALISAMDTANTGLIDMVVQTTQTPTYSKMAIVPWTNAVNMGSSTIANNVRGTPTPGVTISSVTWSSGTSTSISAITQANPGVITISSTTSLNNNDWVYISGVKGMTQINGEIGQIASLNTSKKTFSLNVGGSNLNTKSSNGYSAYSSSGTVTKCLMANCEELVTTSSAHGLSTNDYAYILNVSGMTSFTSTVWQITKQTSTTYTANGSSPANGIRTSGGTSYCAQYGCIYYYFANDSGGHTLYQANNCATERTTNAATDTAPSTTPLGFNYTSSASACITQSIQPLTSSRTTLHALVKTLSAGGSTAGHLGLAWGWYMIAPNFGYLWPTASQPAAYGRANLIKAVILMTDGQFNLQYCGGVLDTNSGNGSGYANCPSPNGSSRTQAQAICDAIKAPANDVILYTVGFYLGNDTDSLNFLKGCASAQSDFFQADSGTDLSNAFTAIAQNLNNLRLSK